MYKLAVEDRLCDSRTVVPNMDYPRIWWPESPRIGLSKNQQVRRRGRRRRDVLRVPGHGLQLQSLWRIHSAAVREWL